MELNADNSLVLIRYQDRQLFRHSIIARYVVYDWFNKKEMNIANGEEIQLCIWSPDGESIAYVDKNNVYYQVFEPGTETSMVYKITTDGIPDKIYNGFCDWVYEEEVFGNSKAMWFSSDGQFLAFIHFDDTDVKSETYYMYGDIGKLESQYPTKISLKYPKAGETNPTVEIRVIDLTNIDDSFKVIIPPTDIEDAIVGSVGWLTDRVVGQYVTVLWLNRRQNNATLMAYQALQPTVFNTIENFVELDGWVDADQLHCYEYEEDNSCFIKANDNGWKRIVRIEFSTKFKTNLTPDGVTALQFLGFSSSKNETYAITTAHNINPITDSAFRHLYKINENGEFQCMSCNVLSPDQDTCTYVSNVRFSTDYSFFSFTCSGPGPAYTKIFKNNAQMDEVIVWESNDQVRNLLKEYYRTEIKYLQVPVGPQKEFLASVKLHMPFCYDPTSTRKYPMIVQVYGGPNSVRVLDNFAVGFADYLAQSRNVIFAQIDGRGSGNKGTKMLFTINNGMGTVEIEDQIEVVKYLVENHNFINAEQIGIWGWSYGGYASGMVLVHDDDHVFQGGISVAPVSSWIYYDTIYTERYMGRPLINENLNGYNVSDLNRYAKKMANHEYMVRCFSCFSSPLFVL